MKIKNKPIRTYDELREFTIAIAYAIGEISRVEAEVAINKAFRDFKCELSNAFSKLEIDES